MKQTKKIKQLLAAAISILLIINSPSAAVWAEGTSDLDNGPCEHHLEHDTVCGFDVTGYCEYFCIECLEPVVESESNPEPLPEALSDTSLSEENVLIIEEDSEVYSDSGPLVVTTAEDTVDNSDGVTSLREAIANAQKDDIITFSDDLFGADGNTPITILLTSALKAKKNISIIGKTTANGVPLVTLDAYDEGTAYPVLQTSPNAISLYGLIIKNGHAPYNGGGVQTGDITATNCAFVNNVSGKGAGGAVFADSITAVNCTFTGNSAGKSSGGAVFASKTATAINCTFTGNAASSGGGVFATNIYLYHSTVAKNDTSRGVFASKSLYLYNSVIAGNSTYGEISPETYTGTSVIAGENSYTYDNIFGSTPVTTRGLLFPLSMAEDINTAAHLTTENIESPDSMDKTEIISALTTDAAGEERNYPAATYGAVESVRYTVAVNESAAFSSGAGSYVEGETVYINAGKKNNRIFNGWTVTSGNVTFNDKYDPATTFIMPGEDVVVQANWIETPPADVPGMEINGTVTFAGYQWWVIGKNGEGVNSHSNTVTLFAKDHLIPAGVFGQTSEYGTSSLKDRMETFYSRLPEASKALILPRKLDGVRVGDNTSSTLDGDHYVWPLSLDETKNLPTYIRAKHKEWWLRSPDPLHLIGAYAINAEGSVLHGWHVSYNWSSRPALTLDLSKTPTITATAGEGGTISPTGEIPVLPNDNQIFTIEADTGYRIDNVKVDSQNMGSITSYSFENVTEDHTIEAIFVKDSGSTGHTHSYGSKWEYDADNHWHQCSCGAKFQKDAHVYGTWSIVRETSEKEAGSTHRECTVCGYEQTETNTYRTLTDPMTGVAVSGYFTSDAALSVTESVLHAEGSCPICDEIRARQAAGELVVLHEISLTSGIHNGEVEIAIPVDKKYNGQTLILLHCRDRKEERRKIEAKNGFVTGTFQSMSPFAVIETTKVTSIKLSSSSLTLELGKTKKLQASVTPADAFNKKTVWTSSNKNVAAVSASGQVRAVKAGTATVTCTAADGSGVKATCRITVRNTATPILILRGTAGKNSIRLNWNAISNADGYDIYGSRCGKNYKYKKIKTISNGNTKTWTQGRLKSATAYKYYAKAYKLVNGKKLYLRTSKTSHSVTTGGKYTNVKTVNTTFTDITLAKGKTRQISTKVVPVKKSGKLASHVPKFRYKTTNSNVAAVTDSGKIKATGKGKCSVYVYANNGVTERIYITVP